MEKIKLGIIGYGNMGMAHVHSLMSGAVPDMELGAICDFSKTRRDAFKNKYPNIPVFDTAEKLYKSGLCDSVLIAVPHYDHPPLAILAFNYGLNVIIEKPAGVYTKQVLEMNEVAKKSGKLFGIMYNQRTNPMYQKLREMIQRGDLGEIKRITWIITDWYRSQAYHDSSSWRSTWAGEGGGTLINQNPHQLDLWQWMFGMPDKLMSHVSFGKYYDIEVEDDVTAFMQYENGTTGLYITSTGEFPGTNRLEVACDMGKVVIENDKMTFYRNIISEREFNQNNEKPFGCPENWKCEIPVLKNGDQHVGILKNFAGALKNGTPLLAPGFEGINGLIISNAIHYSAWTGDWADVKNFPHDEFYSLLQNKVKGSKKKAVTKQVVADLDGTY